MVSKVTWVHKSFMAMLTLEGFCPRVDVHVSISDVFAGKHFRTEIAVECRGQMSFKVMIKCTLGGKGLWTLVTFVHESCHRVRVPLWNFRFSSETLCYGRTSRLVRSVGFNRLQ